MSLEKRIDEKMFTPQVIKLLRNIEIIYKRPINELVMLYSKAYLRLPETSYNKQYEALYKTFRVYRINKAREKRIEKNGN